MAQRRMGRRRRGSGMMAYLNLGYSDPASHMQIYVYRVMQYLIIGEHGACMHKYNCVQFETYYNLQL